MKRLIEKLSAKVVLHPREASIVILVLSAIVAVQGLIVLSK